jgi:hypothetical protein
MTKPLRREKLLKAPFPQSPRVSMMIRTGTRAKERKDDNQGREKRRKSGAPLE